MGTFVKVIHDPSRDVRSDASNAILQLMRYSNKFDNLLRDLNNYLKKLFVATQQQQQQEETDNNITISILSTMSNVLNLIGVRVKPTILDDISNTFQVSDHFRTERDDVLRFTASKCVAAIIHCIVDEEEKDEMIVTLLDIDDDDDDWRSIEYDLNSLAFIISDTTVYTQSIHEKYKNDIIQTFEALLESQQVLVKIAALRIGYNLVGRIANFNHVTIKKRMETINDLLDKHLLPLLSPKVNNNNQDIVISSTEFLLDAMLSLNGDTNEEEEEEEKKMMIEDHPIWTSSEIHQVIIPYLIENHLNNVQPELMRKCITTLLNIDRDTKNLKYYQQFIQNCNQKNVAKELTAIIDALSKTSSY